MIEVMCWSSSVIMGCEEMLRNKHNHGLICYCVILVRTIVLWRYIARADSRECVVITGNIDTPSCDTCVMERYITTDDSVILVSNPQSNLAFVSKTMYIYIYIYPSLPYIQGGRRSPAVACWASDQLGR